MTQFQEYPKHMKHPQHRPAVIAKWDHKEKDPSKQPKGAPERFPEVMVHNYDQEQEYAAKGYVPSGVSDPEAYRRAKTGNDFKPDNSFMAYPKWLYHKPEKSESDELDSKLVQNEAEEKALGDGWYSTPDKARAGSGKPAEEEQQPAQVKAQVKARGAKKAKKSVPSGKARKTQPEARR